MIQQRLTDYGPTIIDRAWLPDSMQPVIDLIGLDSVLLLIDTFGGTAISVPPHGSNWPNPLKEVLDEQALAALTQQYSGLALPLPPPSVVVREIRNHSIANDIEKNGLSHNEIARKYGMSRRWAIEMAKRVRAGKPIAQPLGRPATKHDDLFGG